MNNLTLGSLFDGSGGFPLAALHSNITPIWASEVEPFPIRVTSKRLPQIKHLGDIHNIHGDEITPVDIITFGSPCTNLSVAGKREGLGGEQSVLFYEAIRIIKEMRCKTNGKYPRFAIWENVPGAFSSNKGEDFKSVLEAFISIKSENAQVPATEKWPYADCYVGDGWSIAYRIVDARHFGVPQRRRRIYFVADFGSERAFEILFEPKGVSRDFKASRLSWERTPTDVKTSIGDASTGITAGFCTEHSAQSRSVGFEDECSPTLRAGTCPAAVYENHSQDTRYKGPVDTAPTISANFGLGGNNQPFVVSETPKTMKIRSGCDGGGKGALVQDDMSATLSCNNEQSVFVPVVLNERTQALSTSEDVANTLLGTDYKGVQCVCEPTAFGICSDGSNSMKSDNPHSGVYKAQTSRTIDANGGNPSCHQGGMAVVSLQGSMIGRKDKNGPQGDGVNEDISFTLNATDKHAVVYGIDRESFNCGKNYARNLGISENGVSSTLNAQGPTAVAHPASFYPQMKAESQCYRNDGTANTLVNGTNPGYQNGVVEPSYVVRRLTPTECAALQGFPKWWCSDLETENPTKEELDWWSEVFETHRKIMGKSTKPKSEKQIIKWLKNPHSDSAEYKMWGNGVALPCVIFVLRGIVELTQNEST